MDKKFISDISDFYNQQRILSYVKKREKSIIIPHVLFYIERLIKHKLKINKNNKQKIYLKVLDIGCGEGNLLEVIQDLFNIRFKDNYKNIKLDLFGWDNDIDLIRKAKNKMKHTKFEEVDLLSVNYRKYYGKFDLVIAVNTFHEVFSNFLMDEKKNAKNVKLQFLNSKQRIQELFSKFEKIISSDGTFMLFDGCNNDNGNPERKIKFRIKNRVLKKYVRKFIKDSCIYHMKIKNLYDNVYESNYRDFVRFVIYFKYFNTKVWEIESKECYQYLNLDEFQQLFKDIDLNVESINLILNDLGLYSENLDIISENEQFPVHSALIVGSRKYLPTEFDYFCYELNNGNSH
jgi:SAM-dependent methyltransferase